MHIFILHNKTEAGSYAEALYQLLLQLLIEQDFIITEADEIKQIQETGFHSANTAIVLHTEEKTPSFLARFKLQNTIRKKGFTHLVQVTDAKLITAGLPQFIFTNHPESITAKASQNSVVVVCSQVSKQDAIMKQPEILAKHIQVIPVAADNSFHSSSWSNQQALKMQHTQGREYFLTSAKGKTLPVFTELLKAFSTFKKWQHSSMKLVVTGRLSFVETEEWKEKISTYKFRDDVILLDKMSNTNIVDVIAGAYVFIHIPALDNDLIPLLQATQCEVPSISFKTGSIEEYFDESAIIIEPNNYDQLAEKMILLYKDEALRSRLIAKGKEVSQRYSKENTFAALSGVLSLPLH